MVVLSTMPNVNMNFNHSLQHSKLNVVDMLIVSKKQKEAHLITKL